ncbi:MAG: hypothetical protein GX033_02755 [Firmicutes bacterium]|nr:hypothetical protein [Bacillota bacterium]
MFWVTLVGVILLVAWVVWVLYIVNPERQVAVSIMLKVEQAEAWLDPFLRTACHLFSRVGHLRLLEIWVLAVDEGKNEQQIVERLRRTHPALYFQAGVSDVGDILARARGQVLWYFDMVEHNSPLSTLQALEQLLLPSGPMSPGSTVLEKSPI